MKGQKVSKLNWIMLSMISFVGTYDSGIQSLFRIFAEIPQSTSSFFNLDSATNFNFKGFASFTTNP